MQLKLAKFGIVELARTGKISLKRGRQVRCMLPVVNASAQRHADTHQWQYATFNGRVNLGACQSISDACAFL